MGLITKGKTWADNEVVNYTDLNGNFDTAYNVINGNLDTNNVDTTAIATVGTSQTLTGKTLTSPIITGSAGAAPTTAGQIQFDSTANLLKYGDGTGTITIGGGWVPYSAVTPTSGTLDDPTFELTFASVDLSTTLYAGMRIKLTQSTVKYFIITKVAYSTNTTVTLYGGTDYDLVSTGTTAVSAFAYSETKAPSGFPMDPDKWTVTVTDTSSTATSTYAQNVYQNLGSFSIDVPIGMWHMTVRGGMQQIRSGAGPIGQYHALSTTTNTASDAEMIWFTTGGSGDSYRGGIMDIRGKFITLTTKDTYYLNTMCSVATGITAIQIRGDIVTLKIRAICAYL